MNNLKKVKIHIEADENGMCETEINGTTPALLSGLSMLVRSLREEDIEEDLIKRAVEVGFMTDKELKKRAKELQKNTKELRQNLKKALDKMLKELN